MPLPDPGDDRTVVARIKPPRLEDPAGRRGADAAAARPDRRLWLAGGAAGLVVAVAAGWFALHAAAPPDARPAAQETATAGPAMPPAASVATPAPAPVAAAPVPQPQTAAAQTAAAPTAAAPTAAAPAPGQTELATLAPPAASPGAPPPAEAASFDLRSGDEATIAAHDSNQLTVFRFAAAPSIVVLDFPSLLAQGLTLNRIAAFTEKAGLPRDRVLNDAELAQAVHSRGDTTETYYYGHDYTAAQLARFFALADRDGIRLNPSEEQLRALLRQLGWLSPDAGGALLSFSRAGIGTGADADITPPTRAVILHHELSHGAFFTDPHFAGYVRAFWRSVLSQKERQAIRAFLGHDGYDTADEELMLNEMQAYLMYTHDPGFFDPQDMGIAPAHRAKLEAAFRHGIPAASWIRTMPADPPGIVPATASATSAGCGSAQPCR